MIRVLLSQKETNSSEEYVVANGKLVDNNKARYYNQMQRAHNWKTVYKNEFLELKKNKGKLFIKSHYIDKDNLNRNIFFVYMSSNYHDMLSLAIDLKKDSEIINRKLDLKKIQESLLDCEKKERQKRISKTIFMLLVIIGVIYLILKF